MLAAFETRRPTAQEKRAAYSKRAANSRKFEAFFEQTELLLSPTYGDIAPLFTKGFDPPVPTQRWAATTTSNNEFGLPAA
jgi:Asp-tRNA(Asn)/Glu-tRNA(Gln) amidotransferase A subunit family amidase